MSLEEERRWRERSDKAAVEHFLRANGFPSDDVNGKRRRMLRTAFPLHVAVEQGNAQIVELLLWMGGDASKRNSSGQTPEDLARKLHKKPAAAGVLGVLQAAAE